MDGLRFHHVGVACRDLEAEERMYAQIGYTREGDDFEDPIQGVRGRFLIGGGPRLELLSELPGSTVLTPWLRKGVKMYHFAYEVSDLTAADTSVVSFGAKQLVAPSPAVAFAGRCIAFYMLPNGFVIEFIEAPLRSTEGSVAVDALTTAVRLDRWYQ